MFNTKNIILILSAVAAVVLVAAATINSGILKKPTKTQTSTQTSTQSSTTSATGSIPPGAETGPVDGKYSFKGTLTSVKSVSGGTEIVVEWRVDSSKIEKRTLLVTSSAKVTEGPEGTAAQPSSANSLKVGQEVVIEATLTAKTVTWTVNSVHILK